MLIIYFSYIAKTETAAEDQNYIINAKLASRGKPIKLNSAKSASTTDSQSADIKRGTMLPLFSELSDPQYYISQLIKIYGADLKLFGYTYKIDDSDRKVYALCEMYTASMYCI